jgi:hypothetical protein
MYLTGMQIISESANSALNWIRLAANSKDSMLGKEYRAEMKKKNAAKRQIIRHKMYRTGIKINVIGVKNFYCVLIFIKI